MHLKFGYCVLYTQLYRLPERKNAERLVRTQVMCFFMKKTYGKNNHNRTRSSVFMHKMTESVTIQGNLTAMGYRNDVIRSVLLLLNIRAKYRMMLPRDFASCYAVRSTLLMLVANKVQQLRWPAKSLDWNLIDPAFWKQHSLHNIYTQCTIQGTWPITKLGNFISKSRQESNQRLYVRPLVSHDHVYICIIDFKVL